MKYGARYTQSGIYLIWCRANKTFYVGQSVNMQQRCSEHFSRLRAGVHKNKYLQNAYNKYGEASFEVRYLVICPVEQLLFYEQRCLDLFRKRYNTFNADAPVASPMLGRKRPDRDKCIATLNAQRENAHAVWRTRFAQDATFREHISANCRRGYFIMQQNPDNEVKRKAAARRATQTPEFREKQRQILLKRIASGNGMRRPEKPYSIAVKCLTTGIVYPSYQAAADALGKSPATIHRWVNGRKVGNRITDKKQDWIIYNGKD